MSPKNRLEPGAQKALESAIQLEMLTPQEIQACWTGDAYVSGHTLMNINSSLILTQSGVWIPLYKGRGIELAIDALLNTHQS